MSASIARLVRSFEEQDAGLEALDPLAFHGYRDQLERARADADLDEACAWGWADIDGERCALVVFDFDFLGGSMGTVAGEKIARAFDAASEERSPVVTVTASGGARMQEGMWSLVQMAKTVEARRLHAAAGLAHVTLLTSPTTGGVYASFASLADVVYAQADATIGFAGPRVVEQVTGERPPTDMHTPEFAYTHGLIDAIVEADEAPAAIGRALRALSGRITDNKGEQISRAPGEDAGSAEPLSAWERVQLVRDAGRPKAREVLDSFLDGAIELRGDRSGEADDEHVVVRVGSLRGSTRSVVAIGQDASGDGRIRPQGFRKAVRAIELAGRLGRPVLTLIDTRGADPAASSEAHGVAVSIAQTFHAMLACPSPTLAVLIGEGGSGGALAMAVADSVIALENAVFSVIAPEGAAAILYRDASRAPELADQMRITVPDLVDLRLVDITVREPHGGVRETHHATMQNLRNTVDREIERLGAVDAQERAAARHAKWRTIAAPESAGQPGE